jgi:hypothetical protein
MERWSVVHRTAAVHFYYETKSIIKTYSHVRQQFNVPRHGATPSCNAILISICKSEDNDSVRDIPHGAPRTVQTAENVRRVRGSFQCSPRRSAWQQARILGISRRSMGWILQDIRLHTYKIQTAQPVEASHGQHVHWTSQYQTPFCGDICKNKYTETATTQHRTWKVQFKMKLL